MAKKRSRHRKARRESRKDAGLRRAQERRHRNAHRAAKRMGLTIKQRERRILLGAKTARKWWNSRKAKKIAKVSRKHRHWVSMKIRRLIGEGKKQVQAVAIALSMARKKFKTKRRPR